MTSSSLGYRPRPKVETTIQMLLDALSLDANRRLTNMN